MTVQECPQCKRRFPSGTLTCAYDGERLVPIDSGEQDPAQAAPLEGKLIAGRYRVLNRLREGGMGEVYLAEHVTIEKRIAIKVLKFEYSQRADIVARFLQEARSASRIKHINVVDISDFGQLEDGRFFLAMEYLQGCDLADAMRTLGNISPTRALGIVLQVCRALAAAHASGVVHRDMKPENIFLLRTGEGEEIVKIVDFGIAQMRQLSQGAGDPNAPPERRLTQEGMIFGTPAYMAPEQAAAKEVDHRADIYAVGVILYELFAQRVPFHGTTLVQTLSMHLSNPVPPLREANPSLSISPALEAVILKALAKAPAERWPTMNAFTEALYACPEAAPFAYAPAARASQPRWPPDPPHPPQLVPSGNQGTPSLREGKQARTASSIWGVPGSSEGSSSLSRPAQPVDKGAPTLEAIPIDISLPSPAPIPLFHRTAAPRLQTDAPSSGPAQHSSSRPARSRGARISRSLVATLLVVLAAADIFIVPNPLFSKQINQIKLFSQSLFSSAHRAISPILPSAAALHPLLSQQPNEAQSTTPSTTPTPLPVSPTTRVLLHIKTDPPGALVREEGIPICSESPCDIYADRNEQLDLSAEKGELRGAVKTVAGGEKTITIPLR